MADTLRQAFPEVKVVPGDSNIFLASAASLTVDSGELIRTLRRLGYEQPLHNAGTASRASPSARIETRGEDRGRAGPSEFGSASDQLFLRFRAVEHPDKGAEVKVLTFLARIPVLAVERPSLRFTGFLVFIGWKGTSSGNSVVPVALMGMTTMAGEIMILIGSNPSMDTSTARSP